VTWLVACEYSGTVRDALIAEGIDAISCDLLPTEADGPHIVGDVRVQLTRRWAGVIATQWGQYADLLTEHSP